MITEPEKVSVAVHGTNLWKVGFHFHSLSMMKALSGLVEVREVAWLEGSGVLIFVVENKDRTGLLFHKGELTATDVGGYVPSGQPLMVQGPEVSFRLLRGGDECLRN